MATATLSHDRGRTSDEKPPTPVLKPTRYDKASSWMLAMVIALAVAVVWMTALYLANRRIKTEHHTPVMEPIELRGGVEDGSPDETLKVESPKELTDDPAVTDTEEIAQIQEIVEPVAELSPNAAVQVEQQFDLAEESTGKAGSADGTGRPALGEDRPIVGVPRHQRWFIRFADRDTVQSYARQLDYFGIELGCYKPSEGVLYYIKNLSSDRPDVTKKESGRDERLYFNWQGGGRRRADIELFNRAGIDARDGHIFHFYPRQTVKKLARAEQEYTNRPVRQVRRTYFVVRRDGRGYKFEVSRMTFF